MEMLDQTTRRVWLHFPATLCREREKKLSEYCSLFLPMAGIEPGPPAQQSIALLPLSKHENLDP